MTTYLMNMPREALARHTIAELDGMIEHHVALHVHGGEPCDCVYRVTANGSSDFGHNHRLDVPDVLTP